MSRFNPNNLLNNILRDLRVDLTDEFDRNFERKGFFNDPWPDTKHGNHRGSLMIRSGDLRRGLECDVENYGLRFTNSMPYATIHNEGGTTHPTVTAKMRAWAWYKHKETGEDWYKHIALTKKANLEVKIPKRQFIGDHPKVSKIVEECISTNMEDFLKQFDAEIRR